MSIKDGGTAACAWCHRASHIRQGRINLCGMHYRISSMRARAKRDGKSVPSREEIEGLASSGMSCFGCGQEMHWLRDNGASSQATLQHDRDGTIRLLCLGCNTRHAQHPGDTYYDIAEGNKWCPDCNQVLPVEDFSVDKSRPVGRKSYCKPCASLRYKSWAAERAKQESADD